MSSEPQITSGTAAQTFTERILTHRQADLLPVHDVVGRWLHREPAFLHEHEPEHLPGAVHDLTAARIWGIIPALAACGLVVAKAIHVLQTREIGG
jgi:hypothetical protein